MPLVLSEVQIQALRTLDWMSDDVRDEVRNRRSGRTTVRAVHYLYRMLRSPGVAVEIMDHVRFNRSSEHMLASIRHVAYVSIPRLGLDWLGWATHRSMVEAWAKPDSLPPRFNADHWLQTLGGQGSVSDAPSKEFAELREYATANLNTGCAPDEDDTYYRSIVAALDRLARLEAALPQPHNQKSVWEFLRD